MLSKPNLTVTAKYCSSQKSSRHTSAATMADAKPVRNGHDAGAFDVEYQMPNKAEPQLDHQGRLRSSKLRCLQVFLRTLRLPSAAVAGWVPYVLLFVMNA